MVDTTIVAVAFILGILIGVSLFVTLYKNGFLDGDE
jgi:hypothetical protein